MDFSTFILLGLSVGVSVGAPLYILFRDKMGKRLAQVSNYSRRRVFKLTVINLTLNILVGSILIGMFLNLLMLSKAFGFFQIVCSLLFFISAGATFYGNGIYITSIVLEAYTLPQIQRVKEFKTQFIATHLFHGPISHVLIYSGWPVAMFFLALLEHLSLTGFLYPKYLLIVGAMTTAVAYSIGQIYNHTAPYQMITNTILGIVLFTRFLSIQILGPIYIYSMVFTITSGLVLWGYTIVQSFPRLFQWRTWQKKKLEL